ncbi:MAG TPA: winged helix-turn-helix transcriptional regulator [Thermoplasmata archaeon]|nr:winged helix-turn-helix transcriptional regulator [Thermoplasmata archaeon]
MDRMDLAIFREMWRDRIVWMGGWDPGMSASRVARRLALSTSTVSERLRKWRQSGFIHGLKIFPNPQLLDVQFRSTHIFPKDPKGFAAVERMLRLVPNLVHALEIETGFWTVWLDDGGDLLERSLALVATVPGIQIDPEIWPLSFPRVLRRPLRRDWEMIAQLARQPEASPSDLAIRLGITPKAAARRLARLVSDNLVFFHPITDFTVAPGVVVNFRIQLEERADLAGVWRELEALDPMLVPQGDWSDDRLVTLHELPGDPEASYIAFYWSFDSAAQVWERTRRMAQIRGVRRVVHQFVARVWRGPSCLESRLMSVAASHGVHQVAAAVTPRRIRVAQ